MFAYSKSGFKSANLLSIFLHQLSIHFQAYFLAHLAKQQVLFFVESYRIPRIDHRTAFGLVYSAYLSLLQAFEKLSSTQVYVDELL